MTSRERLEARWLRKHGGHSNAHRVTISGRPARTRWRLAAHRRIDRVGAWLCGHGHTRTAERMWRACRMI